MQIIDGRYRNYDPSGIQDIIAAQQGGDPSLEIKPCMNVQHPYFLERQANPYASIQPNLLRIYVDILNIGVDCDRRVIVMFNLLYRRHYYIRSVFGIMNPMKLFKELIEDWKFKCYVGRLNKVV